MIESIVRRPVATWMVALAVAVFGLVGYGRLPVDLMPDLSYPALTVRTEVPGYAPEEVESQVSRPVEEALATTQSLVEIESRSRAGQSDVVLEFGWGTDMDRAAQDVRERLQTTGLPDDAERPLLLRYDPSLDPILRIALAVDPAAEQAPEGDQALFALRELAEGPIKREMEAMEGVAAVRVRGGLEREVAVEVREDWLVARGVTIDQVIATLGAENVNLPGGLVREGERDVLVRTLNEIRAVPEIEALEVRRADGLAVPLSQVALVHETHRDREVVSRLDGREAVEMEVHKAGDANLVRVAQEVRRRLRPSEEEAGEVGPAVSRGGSRSKPRASRPGSMAGGGAAAADQGGDLRRRLPDWATVVVLDDQAAFVEEALANLRSAVVEGAVLSIVVLFLFLRDFRATAVVGACIPLSVVGTLAALYLGGVSLNLMSLGGMALGVGNLLDNAIVVLESVDVHRARGKDRFRATIDGTGEVAAAVTASTLTTVAVFGPVVLVEGIAGQLFRDLALAVVVSQVVSLVVALTLVPVMAAAAPPAAGDRPAFRSIARSVQFRSFAQLRDSWRSGAGRWRLPYWIVRFLVRLVFEIVGSAIVAITAPIVRVAFVSFRLLGGPFVRLAMGAAALFQRWFAVQAARYAHALERILAHPGAVLATCALAVLATSLLATQLGQALLPDVHQGRFAAEVALPVGTPLGRTVDLVRQAEPLLREVGGVEHIHAVMGSERRADSRPDEGEHTARILVQLVPGGSVARREGRAIDDVRSALTALRSDLDVRMTRPGLFSFRTPVEVLVYGTDLDQLAAAARDVERAVTGVPGLADVRSSLVPGYPEVRVRYRRELLARLGLDTATVAARVREKVQGEVATSLSHADGRVDLVVRLAEDERRTVEDLRRLNVNPSLVPPIPLDAVAEIEEGIGPSEVRRVDQRRAAVVSASVQGFDLAGRAAAIAAELGRIDLSGAEWEMGGQDREMRRSLGSLAGALGLALFLVYVIMAATFESVLHPLVILFSVPLAIVGAVLALGATGTPLSVVVLIGAIVLCGIVVNNAIVLVDAVNRLRDEGLELDRAVRDAAALRLRPVLMTTATTVIGLAPLVLGLGEGAEVQRPLAITVAAGLTSSTLLTLVVIPVLYILAARIFERRATA